MNPTMQYIDEGDILYYRINDKKIARTIERFDHIHVDLDAEGRAVAVEIVWASQVPAKAVAEVFREFGLVVDFPKEAA